MSIQTSPPPTPTALPLDVPTEPIYRLSVEQYHQMIRAGILTEGDPVELLEGWLVQKMGKNRPHSVATRRLRKALERIVPEGWIVDSQEPVTTDTSEPEPDGLVARAGTESDVERQPQPQDVAMVVEVAESTLRRDRGFKKRIYARAGVPVYWIVNLVDRQIEVYTGPTGPAEPPDYRQRQDCGPAAEVPVLIDGREVGRVLVRNVLP